MRRRKCIDLINLGTLGHQVYKPCTSTNHLKLRRCIDAHGEVALGFHFCYGDYDHKHYMEPKDARVMVDLANAIFRETSRRVDWVHMPVPKERDDDAYFAPLADLGLPAGTQLYLGLVHYTDGLEGGKRRIATAQRHVPAFGVATECGLGRRPPETIRDVMKLMAALASA